MKTDLAVVDAAEIVRKGIREIVSSAQSIELVGECPTIQDFYQFLTNTSIEVVLLGDNATPKSLRQTVQRLLQDHPKLKVITLANTFSTELIDELTALGVLGFICKDEELGDFLTTAVRFAKRGDVYISPKTARSLFLASNGHNGVSLSQKQLSVLHYMADYLTPQEIADKLEVSISSVYSLQQRVRILLGVKTTGQILIEATKRGLIGEQK